MEERPMQIGGCAGEEDRLCAGEAGREDGRGADGAWARMTEGRRAAVG